MKLLFDPSAVGLYVHVPFCASICGYCDFYRVLDRGGGVPADFEELLLMEAALYRESPPVELDSLYFGGGTPSLLGPERLGRLIRGLGAVFAFRPDSEVTLEANPETVTPAALRGWLDGGVTRLSIGVQSFDEGVLAALDRRAGPARALEAVEQAASAGFRRLSVDMMTGVPGQDADSLEADLERAAQLPVDHLSFYSLDLHPQTKLHRAVLLGRQLLPDDDAAAQMWERSHELLTERGFEHYEVSNFARPGGRCRHNLRTWQGGDGIGLGPAAWGRFRARLLANPRSLARWRLALKEGRTPWESVEPLSARRQKQDLLIFGLRVSDGVPLESVEELLAEDGRDPLAIVKALTDHGYAVCEEGVLRLTPLGFLMSSEVLVYLLPRGWAGSSSRARATPGRGAGRCAT
ncbi:MAG: radical SAM family heme chaperone HemW [Acidobacteriota bacterium]